MRLDSPQENGCSFSLSGAQHFKVHGVFHIYYVRFVSLFILPTKVGHFRTNKLMKEGYPNEY